jgi:hypothetical protein
MHPGASTGKSRGVIRDNLTVSRHDPQERRSIGTLPAAETGSY